MGLEGIMRESNQHSNNKIVIHLGATRWLFLLYSIVVAMIGYQIHQSVFWTIVDFFFSAVVPIKWLIFHEINLTIIKETFAFLLT